MIVHLLPYTNSMDYFGSTDYRRFWWTMDVFVCSGSNDHTTKFWCRNRPGDTARDKFGTGKPNWIAKIENMTWLVDLGGMVWADLSWNTIVELLISSLCIVHK